MDSNGWFTVSEDLGLTKYNFSLQTITVRLGGAPGAVIDMISRKWLLHSYVMSVLL